MFSSPILLSFLSLITYVIILFCCPVIVLWGPLLSKYLLTNPDIPLILYMVLACSDQRLYILENKIFVAFIKMFIEIQFFHSIHIVKIRKCIVSRKFCNHSHNGLVYHSLFHLIKELHGKMAKVLTLKCNLQEYLFKIKLL